MTPGTPSRAAISRPKRRPRSTRRSTTSRKRPVIRLQKGAALAAPFGTKREPPVKKFIPLVLVLLALPSFASAASPRSAAPAPYAGQCGLPAAQPLWLEFGWPTPAFNAILGKPGVAIGASSGTYPSQMRATGTATVYFDLHLNNRVGTTTKPADPTLMASRAKTL